jgi:hypothetical protein
VFALQHYETIALPLLSISPNQSVLSFQWMSCRVRQPPRRKQIGAAMTFQLLIATFDPAS